MLQSSLDGQMSSLRQTVLDKEASDISEAMAQVKNSSGKQIEAARKQWLKEVVCVSVCVSLSACLSVSPSVCQSICLSVRLSVSPSVCLPVCLSASLSVCLSVCLSVRL